MPSNMKFLVYPIVFMSLFGLQRSAMADVYKCIAADGSVTLSNVEKGKQCTKMTLPPSTAPKKTSSPDRKEEVATVPASRPAEKHKSSYEAAASERKRVISEEMDIERSRLSVVQNRIKALSAVQNKSPDQVKELIGLQQKESMHASNIQILQKELMR